MSQPADLDEVRRPWLPGCLSAHGLDEEAVHEFSYIVVEEIVEDVAELILSAWPYADGHGRLRFDVASSLELCLPLEALHTQVYRGWMRRRPRIGDVFGGRVDRVAIEAARGGLWADPLERIIPGPLYDLRSEARKVARLALYAGVTNLLTTQQVMDMKADTAIDTDASKAKVRTRVGPPPGRSAP